MPPQDLRDYQREGIEKILDAWRNGARSVLCVSPTGSGKTTLFTSLAHQIAPKPTLINVHRRELAIQATNRLREFGVEFGLIMSGEDRKPYAPVQVASVPTLVKRLGQAPRAVLVVNDEAHLSTANTWRQVLATYPNARILGVTATPWRLSGKPLASQYDAVVVVASPSDLRRQGHLCDYVGFSYKTPDLSKVKTTAGDYNEKQSAAAMSQGLIVDNVVDEWGKHARHLSTVVFNVTVEHSRAVTARFKAAGISAEHLDGETPLEQRKAILRRVEEGRTMVLCNVGVAVEGLDIPRLKCCVMNRPTKSLARAIQCMGRVRRPWNGVVARIHDHAFVIKLHGLPDAERDYMLNAKPERPPSLTQCDVCFALYQGDVCPACSHVNATKEREEAELNLVETAEKIEFTSGDELKLTPVLPSGPVDIRWGTVSQGRVFEGSLEKVWDEEAEWGPQKMFLIKGEPPRRDYVLPGTTVLNRKMAEVPIGSHIWVTYLGMPGAGRKGRHEFKVEIDDEA